MSVLNIRRFFRFTLRSMLGLTTVIAVIMGMKVNQANSQRAAVAWVLKMQGAVVYDYEYDKVGGLSPMLYCRPLGGCRS